jgi:hypothetical protein
MKNTAEYLICVVMVLVLYINWTSIEVDNERQGLNNKRNSQGILVKLKVEQ